MDYKYQNYNLTFDEGDKVKTLPLTLFHDNIVETDETFNLTIKVFHSRVAVGENGTTTVTINNDDGK